jgi:DNA adenine methylase
LEQRLHAIKGRFVLSLDDHPEVRNIFGGWQISRVELAYTAQTKTGKRYGEVLITNFPVRRVAAAASTPAPP